MVIGYARVSRIDQNEQLQIDALEKYGCEKIYVDKISGAKDERPEMNKLLAHLRTGDVVVVNDIDRWGRSLKHLINSVGELREKKIGFVSLNQNIDTTTEMGELIFNIFAVLAEFERKRLIRRTKAGLAAARAAGRVGGKPKQVIPPQDMKAMIELYDNNEVNQMTVAEIIKPYGISRSTFYKYVFPKTETKKRREREENDE